MKNVVDPPLRCRALIPHVIVVLWLIFLATMIWQHALQSVQVPLSDPLTYIQKAMNFWKAVDQGKLFNPLNIEPTNRPPGTILMSYPLGFSPDFKGFHFRSVFVPICCIILAVYMAAGIPRSAAAGWGVAITAILFSTIPMFYAFDISEINPRPSQWGLVDNFQAGIAAMAAAGFVKSLKMRSLFWLGCGAFLGSFTLLIKPSGFMIMALLTATWLIVIIVEWVWTRKYQQLNSNLHRYVMIGIIQIFLIYAIIVLPCIFSNYLSIQNFEYARQSLKVMGDVLKVSPSLTLFLFFNCAGIAFIMWVLWKGVLILYYRFNCNANHFPLSVETVGLLLSTAVIWCLGVWYWLVVQSGGSQVRYFYPFLLMGSVCIIPISLYYFQNARRWVRITELVLCFLPALNIGALLVLDFPSIQWQQLTGVNVSVGQDREIVNQAYTFLEELRKQNKRPNLYSFISGVLPDIFVNVGVYEGLVRSDLPVFNPITMVDWTHGFIVRTDQLLNVDYILIRKDLGWMADKIVDRPIDSCDSESIIFQTWLCGLNENAGIKTVSDGKVLRVLEIIDRKAFEYALESFVAAHVWRSEFLAANPHLKWLFEVKAPDPDENLAAKEIHYGEMFTLHALTLHRVDKGVKVEIWWEELRHNEANIQQYIFFFHIVDRSGRILHNLSLSMSNYYPLIDNRKWHYGSVTFEYPLSDEATTLAFGIFRPDHDFLMPDKGVRDWEGRRVLVAIPDSAS